MSKQPQSTFEKELKDLSFKKEFDREYKEFVLSELLCAMMAEDKVSVRKLAKAVKLSPTIIQKLRSGEQTDMKISNFANIVREFGYSLVLEKGKNRVYLNSSS
ncbi:MAG: hypothetical protein COA71_03760 [SAR86 cluster bacterium]|uniref:XRE family transcriptional regulator n=1 Tax=SAR86 cluster bacterium TaxID=2030880 RepID=A0A2A5CFG6_9GAMM|nr:hypothetical protein [Gammaproteobacteria bacterium AH-315-E17]PCJ42634.1 MAG: hypothetical protein COA71_03760 [SAR86 cluster bacterium]